MMLSVFCLLLSLTLVPPAASQQARTHDITLEDYFSLDVITQQQIAPDGKHVAFTVARWDKASDGRRVDLWVVDCESKKSRRLTFDHSGLSTLRWADDGKTVYFLARLKREGEKKPPLDGAAQVWRVGIAGGEPFALTRIPGGVSAFDLEASGQGLYYQAAVPRIEGEWRTLKEKFKSIEYGHGVMNSSQLWQLDLETWKSEKVVDEGRIIREFRVAPNGKAIAMITTPDDTVVSFEGRSRVEVFDRKINKSFSIPDRCYRAEAASPHGWLEHLAWNSASTQLAFNVIFDAYPAEIVVAELGKDVWTSRLLSRSLDGRTNWQVHGYGSPLVWASHTSFYVLRESAGRVALRHESPGARSEEYFREDVVESFSVSGNGRHVAVVKNNATHTPDLFLLGDNKRLTNLNPQVDTWKLPKIRPFAWKSKDGTPVEGILELPPDHKEGEKLPLVVCIHGGPTTADRLHLQYWIYGRTLLPAKGYAVLCPNYRGSTGYGDKFLTQLIGKDNELDVADILSGVDALIEKGVADADQLGVMGWSNGGYLTNCVISKTTRFKAASSGAGIVDTVMQWGSNDEPAYMMVFKKGLPWDQPDLYRRSSPTYELGKVRTPTLIHVGANDERCPPAHSKMLHRALKEYVKVPTELLVYPGEPHGLMKYSSRQAKMEWDLAWFDKYLLRKGAK